MTSATRFSIPKKVASKPLKPLLRRSKRLADIPKVQGGGLYQEEDESCASNSSSSEEEETARVVGEKTKGSYSKMTQEEKDASFSPEEEEEVRVIGEKKRKKYTLHKRTDEEDRATRSAQQRATLMGDAFKSTNPFFTVAIQPSYICRKYLPIPASFNHGHMFSRGKRIRAKVEDKEGFWLLNNPKGGRLTVGVSSFVRDNHLVAGDVILVELMEEMTSIYLDARVHISRAAC